MKGNTALCSVATFLLFLCPINAFVSHGLFAARLSSQRSTVSHILKRTQCSGTKQRTEVSTDDPTEFQFQGWVNEEVEIQKEERRRKIKEIEEDGEYVPAYLRELFDRLDEVPQEDVPAGALPIIAVIGRPNTGKSTIVNRLTESYKVSKFLLILFCTSNLLITNRYSGRSNCPRRTRYYSRSHLSNWLLVRL